jgi:hypothetical protein
MDKFLLEHPHISDDTFAATGRTIRNLRKTGRARRGTWQDIADFMGISLEDLLKAE